MASRLLGFDQDDDDLPPARRLLDIGAGTGGVTAQLAPLFADTVVTEASARCVGRLERRGFTAVHCTDPTAEALGPTAPGEPSRPFDVVALFNVLDRCPAPLDLLRRARSHLGDQAGNAEGGGGGESDDAGGSGGGGGGGARRRNRRKLLFSFAVPYTPFVVPVDGNSASGGTDLQQRLGISSGLEPGTPAIGVAAAWEAQVNQLARSTLADQGVLRGLRVEKLARVPYLCQAAAGAEGAARFSVLDTAVFVLGFEQ
jgi:hypothetical protein